MNNTIFKVLIITASLLNLSFSAYSQMNGYGVVNQSVINLKTSSSYASEMSSQALLGTPVHILETANGWIKVITPEGYHAWTTDESITKMKADEFKNWNKASKLIVTTYFSILRKQPTDNADVVSDVVLGDLIRYQGIIGNYYKVQLPDGRTAYLPTAHASPFAKWLSTRKHTSAKIITIAKYFVGFPYLWGGTSIKGMDCSGFSKTCFFMNGVILPRDASQQALTGENIDITKDFSQLQPADLLFFGSKAEGKEHIIHVAIYIGNGEFIHSSGMVKIGCLYTNNSLYDAYNTNRILRAQRILTRIDKDANIVSIEKHPFYQNK